MLYFKKEKMCKSVQYKNYFLLFFHDFIRKLTYTLYYNNFFMKILLLYSQYIIRNLFVQLFKHILCNLFLYIRVQSFFYKTVYNMNTCIQIIL